LDDLDTHTALYADCYVALRILGIRYVEYIQSTTPKERALYQYFLALESLKEQRAHEKAQAESAAKEDAFRAIPPHARA